MRRALWYLVPTAVGALLPIITLPVFTRVLAPAEYGAWILAVVYGAFVSGVANFGMSISYERNFYEFREPRAGAALLYSTLAFVTAMLATGLALTWLFRGRLAALVTQSPANGLLLFWTTCAVGTASLKAYFLLYFRNTQDARSYAWYTVDESILGVTFSLLLVGYWRVGPLGLAWGPLAASLIVLSLLLTRFLGRLPPRFDRRALAQSLRISLPLTPRILLGVVGSQFDKFIVGVVASAGGAAVYAVGQRLANMVFAFMTALENVFQPLTYKAMFDGGDEGGAEVGRLLTPFACASVGVAVLISLGAEDAIALLAPRSYAGAVTIANILTMHYALMFFGKQPQLVYAKRTDLTSGLSILSLFLSVGLTFVLARLYGAVGAALGTFLAGAVSVSLFVLVGQHFYRIRYERGKLALIYGSFIGMALLTLLLRQWQVPWVGRFVVKLGCAGIYALIAWRLGMFRALRLGRLLGPSAA